MQNSFLYLGWGLELEQGWVSSGGSWGANYPMERRGQGAVARAGEAEQETGQVSSAAMCVYIFTLHDGFHVGLILGPLHGAPGNVNVYKAVCSWPGHHHHRKPEIY